MERKLKATTRDGAGKGVARKLRAAGDVPGVLYGHGMAPISVAVNSRDLFHVLHTDAGANVLIDLEVGADTHLAMAREVQRDHVRGEFIHIDFLAIRRDEKITVEVPINITGESHGVREGGIVEHQLWTLRVECLPGDVPEGVDVDITELGIGESLKVADVKAPRGADVLSDPEETVVSVIAPPIMAVEEEAAEAVEGEVPEAEAEGATTDEAQEHAGEDDGGS